VCLLLELVNGRSNPSDEGVCSGDRGIAAKVCSNPLHSTTYEVRVATWPCFLASSGTIRRSQGNKRLMPTVEGVDEAAVAASLISPGSFAGIFERRVDGIYRYLSFRVGTVVAEELTAETFARAFAGRRDYRPEFGSVKAWLYGIATNLLRHHRRDERHRMAMLQRIGPMPSGGDSGTQLVERMQLGNALASLEPGWRNVVLLVGLEGFTYEETAAILRIPIGTVRSRYSRARTQLVALLADPGRIGNTGGAVS
jgi:RNA polymerase sigma factor (sigma-70 family)